MLRRQRLRHALFVSANERNRIAFRASAEGSDEIVPANCISAAIAVKRWRDTPELVRGSYGSPGAIASTRSCDAALPAGT